MNGDYVRHETELGMGIEWQGIAVDGFRPRGKTLGEILQKAGMRTRYRGPIGDRIYCDYGLKIKEEFHDIARKQGLARDDRCLTHFIIPGIEFGEHFEDIQKELESEKSNPLSTYRIIIFQYPKKSCDVQGKCLTNLVDRLGFKIKSDYRNPVAFKIEIECLTKQEIRGSVLDVLNLRIRDPPWDAYYDADYKDGWPRYRDFSYIPFESWYLSLPKDKQEKL